VFEAETEETDVMRRAPRDPEAPLFSAGLILWGVVQGACAFVLVAAMFLLALRADMPVVEARALVFFSLVMAIIALIFVNRSFGTSLLTAVRRPNRTLALVLVAVVAMLGLTLLVPTVSALFRFGPLHPGDLALSAGAGIGLLVLLEGLKWLGSRLPTAWLDRSAW
jgi:Ca2+-transporting ATPase